MRVLLLGLLMFSPTADAMEFSSDVRSERTGSLELVYGTNLSLHFVGTQFYVTDALLVRLHTLVVPHPSSAEIQSLESALEFMGDTGPLPISENEYRTMSFHPGAYFSFAQIGDSSSAVVFQAGGQLLYSTESNADEYKKAMESIDGLELNSNAKKLYAQPSVGVAYVANFDTGSFEVDLTTGPLISVWGDTGYATSEVEGTKYDGTELMRGGWSSLTQLGYRWKRLVVSSGVSYTTPGMSKLATAQCESDEYEGDCKAEPEFVPFFAVGGSLGGA